MEQNKTGKYFKYAIGEIILVVIGILIALQINNWNSKRQETQKANSLVLEIQENLNEDLQKIDAILQFNDLKLKTIDTAYYYLSMMKDNPYLGKNFSQLLPIISNYKSFSPIDVAFNNMNASGSINILTSATLRKEISKYYSNDKLNSIQMQMQVTTQDFLNNLAPKMINETMMKSITKRDFDVIDIKDLKVHNDPQVLSDLFVMLNKIKEHNYLLNATKNQINPLIKMIDDYLIEIE